jgi:cytochrome b561
MQTVTLTARHYDRVTILFHWITAILVTEQWLGAQIIDWFPRGPLRVDARSVHITLGVVLALTIAARLFWRATEGRRLPLADEGVLNLIAKTTHWGLYALLIAMVLVGMALAWTRGDSLFNLFSIPAYDPGNKALAEEIGSIHATIGWIIVGLAGLHAAAALAHQFLWRDGVLARMIPQIKP